jgi:hypothetical protein
VQLQGAFDFNIMDVLLGASGVEKFTRQLERLKTLSLPVKDMYTCADERLYINPMLQFVVAKIIDGKYSQFEIVDV